MNKRTASFVLSGCVSKGGSTSAQVFELNMWRAWGAVATTVASVALSVYLIAISPWYLLPLAWAFAGTAWTGVRLQLGQWLYARIKSNNLQN